MVVSFYIYILQIVETNRHHIIWNHQQKTRKQKKIPTRKCAHLFSSTKIAILFILKHDKISTRAKCHIPFKRILKNNIFNFLNRNFFVFFLLPFVLSFLLPLQFIKKIFFLLLGLGECFSMVFKYL